MYGSGFGHKSAATNTQPNMIPKTPLRWLRLLKILPDRVCVAGCVSCVQALRCSVRHLLPLHNRGRRVALYCTALSRDGPDLWLSPVDPIQNCHRLPMCGPHTTSQRAGTAHVQANTHNPILHQIHTHIRRACPGTQHDAAHARSQMQERSGAC